MSIEFNFLSPYTPPKGDELAFNFTSGNEPEIVSAIVEILVELSTHVITVAEPIVHDQIDILVEVLGSSIEVLTEIVNNQTDLLVELQEHAVQILPDVISNSLEILIELNESLVRSTEAHHLPIKLSTPKGMISWRTKARPINTVYTMPWNKITNIDKIIQVPFSRSKGKDVSISLSWRLRPKNDLVISSPYSLMKPMDLIRSFPYKNRLIYSDICTHFPYGTGKINDKKFVVPYNQPAPKDLKFTSAHKTKAIISDKFYHVPWNKAVKKDVKTAVPWGPYSYYKLCYLGEKYNPPDSKYGVDFKFPTKYDLLEDVCKDITFYMSNYSSNPNTRCPWKHRHTGTRDTPIGPPIIPPRYPPNFPKDKKVYYMLNYVSVRELVTNTPIEVYSASATIDRDSWLWQFQITVTSSKCLEMLKPANRVMTTVILEINGWSWLCTIEGWSENRKYGSDAWTLSGRSPSLMFGDPISRRSSGVETIGKQGQSLFSDIVTAKNAPPFWPTTLENWQANWQTYHNTLPTDPGGITQTGFDPLSQWYIPPNTFSYDNSTEIDILETIVKGIGAYIQTDLYNNVLHVKPIFPFQPWNWLSNNQDINWKYVTEGNFKEISRNSVAKQACQAVYVVGEAQGGLNDGSTPTGALPVGAVFTEVRYTGCGPSVAEYAQMVTNPLVTSSKAAMELGRMVIGATGEWVKHSLHCNILCPPTASNMGLYTPGTMVSVLERSIIWNGQVTGTTISAAKVGNNAVGVEQVLDVEEYVGGIPSCS